MNNLERAEGEISVILKVNAKGYVGCKCQECKTYFKIKLSTGLEEESTCCCPYCGHKTEHNKLFTKEQLEYMKSLVVKNIGWNKHL